MAMLLGFVDIGGLSGLMGSIEEGEVLGYEVVLLRRAFFGGFLYKRRGGWLSLRFVTKSRFLKEFSSSR